MNNQKGFIAPLLLALIALLLIGGGAYAFLNFNKSGQHIVKVATPPAVLDEIAQQMNQTQATSTAQVAECADFGALSQFVLATIDKPDMQKSIEMNPYVISSFHWKRKATEPFITYPISAGVSATYGFSDSDKITATDFMTAIKNDSTVLNQNMSKEAASLGLTRDELNTYPFTSFDLLPSEATLLIKDFNYLQVFSFRKNADLYTIVLRAERNYQAPGSGEVTVTCGKSIDQFDRVYNSLSLTADPKIQDPYENDYVAIADVSPDKTVYALMGSSNRSQSIDSRYYYFDGQAMRLVSTGSYPAACETLESQKVGKGMRCVEPQSNTQRTVTY